MSFYTSRCSAAISLALALGAAPMAVYAQVGYDFNLPTQSLGDSLRAVGRKAHINIVFDPATVRGQNAQALKGTYSAQQAMERLLANTGLVLRRTTGGSFLVEKAGAPGARGNSGADENDQEVDSKVTLDTVVVTAKVQGFAATRLPTELREIPQSVSVISQETLQQQNAFDLSEAFNWATGITGTRNNSTDTQYTARGFGIDTLHIDGGAPLALGGTGINSYQDLSEYDQVEILRGADALFGGAGDPGASINLVRKRPQAEAAANVLATIGSWSNYHLEGDATGPLSAKGALRGRLVMAHDDQDYFYDTAKRKLTKLYGVLDYDLGPSTTLTLGGSVEDMNFVPFTSGLPRYNNGADPRLPRSTSLTFPWARNTSNKTEVFAQLEHRFSDRWKLNVSAARYGQDQNGLQVISQSAINPVTDRFAVLPTARNVGASSTQTTTEATLNGGFDWNGRRQDIVLGADYQRASFPADSTTLAISGPPLNPFNFDPGAYPPPAASPFALTLADLINIRQLGTYAAFRLRPLDGLSIIAGARDNYVRSQVKFNYLLGGTSLLSFASSHVDTGNLTPYAGVVYDINKQYSLYASYADVYSSNSGNASASGAILPVSTGTNLEAGIKGTWNDGRLNGSLAIFKINKDNVSTTDPNVPAGTRPNCCYLAGIQKSKGLEAELSGYVAQGWMISTGYTFNVNRNTGGDVLSTTTPKHLFKLWSSYQLPGSLSGWNVGGGLTAQSPNYVNGTACNAFNLVGRCIGTYAPFRITQGFYTVATLRLAYQFDAHWQAALNLNNVFDRRYYQTVGATTSGNWYGDPRNFMLTIRGSF